MPDRYFLLFIAAVMFLFFLIFCGEMVSQKIKADLIVDMAERGYLQEEIDGKILWLKDEK
jgi:hypothetical protein